MAEEKADNAIVSMEDVLQEHEALEDEANAVLGASDDKECTYAQGYAKRQALYACTTCTNETGSVAGICLACSLHCHDGHDLVELYTKRDFRCDCGNSKFPKFTCKLIPEKDDMNPKNRYNDNFKGLYCTCKRPYPDPEKEEDDEMIQCIVCEDWLHSMHLNSSVPDCDDYHEMICGSCMEKHSFLYAYLSPARLKIDGDETGLASPAKRAKIEGEENCKLAQFRSALGEKVSLLKGPGFFNDDWRSSLCNCSSCRDLLKQEDLAFLLDEEDTTSFYEACGKLQNRDGSSVEAGMHAVQTKFNPVQQIEMFSHYNELKGKLSNYLKDFAEQNKVVTKEDVELFFEKLKESKKGKAAAQIPPGTCK